MYVLILFLVSLGWVGGIQFFAVIIVLASCVASPSFAILSVVRSCSARPVVSVAAVAQLVSWVSSLPSLVFCSLPIILPYRLFPPFPSPNGVLATRGFLPVLSFFPPRVPARRIR